MRLGSPLELRVRIRRKLVNRASIVHPNDEGPLRQVRLTARKVRQGLSERHEPTGLGVLLGGPDVTAQMPSPWHRRRKVIGCAIAVNARLTLLPGIASIRCQIASICAARSAGIGRAR